MVATPRIWKFGSPERALPEIQGPAEWTVEVDSGAVLVFRRGAAHGTKIGISAKLAIGPSCPRRACDRTGIFGEADPPVLHFHLDR